MSIDSKKADRRIGEGDQRVEAINKGTRIKTKIEKE